MNTIFVVFENKKERDHMFSFLTKQEWMDLAKTEPDDSSCITPLMGEDLNLSKSLGKKTIGFYVQNIPQRTWAICAWMAIKSNYKVHNWSVVLYNDEEIPVIVRKDAQLHDKDIIVVSELGFLRSWRGRGQENGPDYESQQEFLLDMESEWQKYKISKRK